MTRFFLVCVGVFLVTAAPARAATIAIDSFLSGAGGDRLSRSRDRLATSSIRDTWLADASLSDLRPHRLSGADRVNDSADVINARASDFLSGTTGIEVDRAPIRDLVAKDNLGLGSIGSTLPICQAAAFLDFEACAGAFRMPDLAQPAPSFDPTVSAVPEPMTLLLFGGGLATLAARARRYSRRT